jgi:hypothetical protein
MENPNKKFWPGAMLFLLGMAVGIFPGAIKLDQMTRQTETERAETAKLNDGLRKGMMNYQQQLAEEKQNHAADRDGCEKIVMGDGARTVLADLNHRYQGPAIFAQTLGVMLEIPDSHREQYAASPGPIWIVPRAIKPQVVADGVFGAVYTHVWPDGRTDGWKPAGRAE